MLDRIFGKADQNINMNGDMAITQMTPEERKLFIDDYIKQYVKKNPDIIQKVDDKDV
jgi:hypothetical protein